MTGPGKRGDRAVALATAGVVLIPLLVPLTEGRVTIGPFPVDAVIVSVVLALLASVPYLRKAGVGSLPVGSVIAPVAVFLGIAAVGTAVHGSLSTVMTWVRYASYFALIPVIGAVTADPARRRLVLWAIVAGGTVTLLHATYQYLNPGQAQAIGMVGLSEDVSTRVYATFENPNFYAEYLVLLFSAGLALVLTERRLARLLATGITLFTGAILLLTYTRGSWLALAFGIALTAAIVNWRLVLPLGAAAAAAAVTLPGVASRLASILSTEGTASFRMRLWRIAGEVIANHPFVGVGLGDFYRGFQEVALSNPGLGVGYAFYGAHNSYFQVAAETGVLGGLAFTVAVLAVCRSAFAFSVARYDDARDRLQAAALLAGIVAFAFNALTSNAFQHPRGAVFFFVLAGVSAGIGTRASWTDPHAISASALPPVLECSLVGRGIVAAVRAVALSTAWRALTRLPDRGGVLASSLTLRLLLGKRRQDRPDAATGAA